MATVIPHAERHIPTKILTPIPNRPLKRTPALLDEDYVIPEPIPRVSEISNVKLSLTSRQVVTCYRPYANRSRLRWLNAVWTAAMSCRCFSPDIKFGPPELHRLIPRVSPIRICDIQHEKDIFSVEKDVCEDVVCSDDADTVRVDDIMIIIPSRRQGIIYYSDTVNTDGPIRTTQELSLSQAIRIQQHISKLYPFFQDLIGLYFAQSRILSKYEVTVNVVDWNNRWELLSTIRHRQWIFQSARTWRILDMTSFEYIDSVTCDDVKKNLDVKSANVECSPDSGQTSKLAREVDDDPGNPLDDPIIRGMISSLPPYPREGCSWQFQNNSVKRDDLAKQHQCLLRSSFSLYTHKASGVENHGLFHENLSVHQNDKWLNLMMTKERNDDLQSLEHSMTDFLHEQHTSEEHELFRALFYENYQILVENTRYCVDTFFNSFSTIVST